MKQHITVEQVNELSEEGKYELRKWWKPTVGDWFVTKYDPLWVIYGREEDNELYGQLPEPQLLTDNPVDSGYYGWSEGENILLRSDKDPSQLKREKEVLSDALPLLSIGEMIEFIRDNDKKHLWSWYFFNGPYATTKDVCDILWEAVKDILETNAKQHK